MALTKETLRVRGMQCSNCENVVEHTLRGLRGVQSARADFGREIVTVTYNSRRCNVFQMAKALELKGYSCQQIVKPRPWRDGIRKFFRIVLGLLGILLIYLAGTAIPVSETVPGLEREASYGLLFVAGLLTSFHCIGMCGGFVVGYSTQGAMGERKRFGFSHIAYGIGKTLSYTVIGAGFGLLGSAVAITPMMKGVAAVLAGFFLLGFGLNMLHLLPHLRIFSFALPRRLTQLIYKGNRKYNHPFIIGLLNGLMIACGPLQAMYVMAAGTGSMREGAFIMFIFGLGTLPMMLGFGFLTSYISHNLTYKILKLSGVIVVSLGVIMLNRGLILTGSGYDLASLTSGLQRQAIGLKDKLGSLADLKGDFQEIRTEVSKNGFEPANFVLHKGMPVRWTLDVKELTECNRTIVVPKLGLTIELKPGVQTVEFTPNTDGMVLWSCWMGMLRGEFQVLDDGPLSAPPQAEEVAPAQQ